MQRIFATLCLSATLAFVAIGCSTEDPEVAKNDVVMIEIIKLSKDNTAMAEAAKKAGAKGGEDVMEKMLTNATKMMEQMEKFQKLPKNVQEKLIAKHKTEWETIQKMMPKTTPPVMTPEAPGKK